MGDCHTRRLPSVHEAHWEAHEMSSFGVVCICDCSQRSVAFKTKSCTTPEGAVLEGDDALGGPLSH